MSLPTAVADHYRAQQRLVVATSALVAAAWGRMDFEDVDGSWAAVAPTIATVVSSGQLGAARNGARYVPTALDEQGLPTRTLGRVSPSAFAGVASNGGSLMDLLSIAPAKVKQAQSLDAGRTWLDMVAHTSVQDAARGAAGVSIASTVGAGWVRMVNPPCCQRCAVLAGKFFRFNRGFQRHPRCDCTHIPTAEANANDVGILIGAEDIKDLTGKQRQAITDGADVNQVINAHRKGARSKNGMTTSEGATRRGVAGKRLGAGRKQRARRLTPEGIYRQAGEDRAEAVRLLRAHGYII